MPDPLKLIPCQPDDAEAIESLASQIWREVYPGIISTEQIEYMLKWMYSPEKIREDMTFGIRFLWINDRDGSLAGFAAYGPDRDDPGIWLHKLYIAPHCQRKGLGSFALKEIEALVSATTDRLLLRVNRNNAKAVAAYTRNGFEVLESRCSDIGNGYVMDDFIMTKRLPTLDG